MRPPTPPHQPVVLLTPADTPASSIDVDGPGLELVPARYNDTWCRDYGPIVMCRAGRRLALDFHFDGWGGKYPAYDDDRVPARLFEQGAFPGESLSRCGLVLEGGAFDTDGAGTLLVNGYCLETRLPGMDRDAISAHLRAELGVQRIAWIHVPALPGDDTDGHIDTLARFASPCDVTWQATGEADTDAHLADQLESALAAAGCAPALHRLPPAEGIESGLPASYANFLFANGALLVPAYGVATDETARAVLADIHPDREVLSVSARAMIHQFGALHCATMHLPAKPS